MSLSSTKADKAVDTESILKTVAKLEEKFANHATVRNDLECRLQQAEQNLQFEVRIRTSLELEVSTLKDIVASCNQATLKQMGFEERALKAEALCGSLHQALALKDTKDTSEISALRVALQNQTGLYKSEKTKSTKLAVEVTVLRSQLDEKFVEIQSLHRKMRAADEQRKEQSSYAKKECDTKLAELRQELSNARNAAYYSEKNLKETLSAKTFSLEQYYVNQINELNALVSQLQEECLRMSQQLVDCQLSAQSNEKRFRAEDEKKIKRLESEHALQMQDLQQQLETAKRAPSAGSFSMHRQGPIVTSVLSPLERLRTLIGNNTTATIFSASSGFYQRPLVQTTLCSGTTSTQFPVQSSFAHQWQQQSQATPTLHMSEGGTVTAQPYVLPRPSSYPSVLETNNYIAPCSNADAASNYHQPAVFEQQVVEKIQAIAEGSQKTVKVQDDRMPGGGRSAVQITSNNAVATKFFSTSNTNSSALQKRSLYRRLFEFEQNKEEANTTADESTLQMQLKQHSNVESEQLKQHRQQQLELAEKEKAENGKFKQPMGLPKSNKSNCRNSNMGNVMPSTKRDVGYVVQSSSEKVAHANMNNNNNNISLLNSDDENEVENYCGDYYRSAAASSCLKEPYVTASKADATPASKFLNLGRFAYDCKGSDQSKPAALQNRVEPAKPAFVRSNNSNSARFVESASFLSNHSEKPNSGSKSAKQRKPLPLDVDASVFPPFSTCGGGSVAKRRRLFDPNKVCIPETPEHNMPKQD